MAKKTGLNKTYIAVALIIGLAVLGYGYLDYRYKSEVMENKIKEEGRARLEKETKESARKSSLSRCIADAESSRSNWWIKNCEDFGSNIERDEDGEITTCSLPGYLGETIYTKEKEEKDRCIELYK